MRLPLGHEHWPARGPGPITLGLLLAFASTAIAQVPESSTIPFSASGQTASPAGVLSAAPRSSAEGAAPDTKSPGRPVLSAAQVPSPTLSSAAWTGAPPWRTPDSGASSTALAPGASPGYNGAYGTGSLAGGFAGAVPQFRAPGSTGRPAPTPPSFAPPVNPYVSTAAPAAVPLSASPTGSVGPVTEKPFSDYRLPPAISPYMNLYRFNPLTGVDNYNLFVRPILEQEAFNRQTSAQLRSLRTATQAVLTAPPAGQSGAATGAIWQGQAIQPSAATFMNLQPYYPAFSPSGRR